MAIETPLLNKEKPALNSVNALQLLSIKLSAWWCQQEQVVSWQQVKEQVQDAEFWEKEALVHPMELIADLCEKRVSMEDALFQLWLVVRLEVMDVVLASIAVAQTDSEWEEDGMDWPSYIQALKDMRQEWTLQLATTLEMTHLEEEAECLILNMMEISGDHPSMQNNLRVFLTPPHGSKE